jgi:hypothetical protein
MRRTTPPVRQIHRRVACEWKAIGNLLLVKSRWQRISSVPHRIPDSTVRHEAQKILLTLDSSITLDHTYMTCIGYILGIVPIGTLLRTYVLVPGNGQTGPGQYYEYRLIMSFSF